MKMKYIFTFEFNSETQSLANNIHKNFIGMERKFPDIHRKKTATLYSLVGNFHERIKGRYKCVQS